MTESFDAEIQFRTPFGYMFEYMARDDSRLLPYSGQGEETVRRLQYLGDQMGDPGEQGTPRPEFDSDIPAVMTYFGQFIDHDLTANTDREGTLINMIESNKGLLPLPMEAVIGDEPQLVNGRRPQFDLDSVYGDGPPLIPGVQTTASELYDQHLKLRLQHEHSYIDLRRQGRDARIADARNDENIIVSQLHAMMLLFHNKVVEGLKANNADRDPAFAYARARQIVRWCYQYIVINEYLPAVCDEAIVEDVVRNGPRFFGPGLNALPLYMPIEFSVAGFRFAHSMIRPFYRLNGRHELKISDLLGPARKRQKGKFDPLEPAGNDYRLKPDFVIEWSNFVPDLYGRHQSARKIDPRLARGLFDLESALGSDRKGANLSHLARSNLLRGYHLRVPTGQAVAEALGIQPLSAKELTATDQKIAEALTDGGFLDRTPLWYYVLQEAAIQKDGNSLGAVGSRLVAEVIAGLIKGDPNSYLHARDHRAATLGGIEVWTPRRDKRRIATLADLIEFAGGPT
ncbi:peroxidase family protein [Rhodovibrio salinarum]|nr:heme peroxidase family protein [Rhodovibrio salinarum]